MSFEHRRGQILRYVFFGGLLLTCLKVWIGPVSIASEVQAQLPDSAAQRKQQIDEQRRTNELLTDIKRILEDRTLKVRLEGADNPASAPISVPESGR